MRVLVAGSRDYRYIDLVMEWMRTLPLDAVVITGGARGVDKAAERAAEARGLKVEIFYPEWERLGQRAGVLRNKTMVDRADLVVVFWDERSPGSRSTIRFARQMKKKLIVFGAVGAELSPDAY